MKNFFIITLLIIILIAGCKKKKEKEITSSDINDKPNIDINNKSDDNKKDEIKKQSFVTFIEIGSVNCIPCKMMKPVMEKIESNYKDKVKVVFYDVWTKEQAHYAQVYNIRVIPTQVFLDIDGKEYYRHEGFFPFEEVEKILKIKL